MDMGPRSRCRRKTLTTHLGVWLSSRMSFVQLSVICGADVAGCGSLPPGPDGQPPGDALLALALQASEYLARATDSQATQADAYHDISRSRGLYYQPQRDGRSC
jgi:hypothetical protein